MSLLRRQLRRILNKALKGEYMFDAFCIDYFPDIHAQFSSGMNRIEKENILIVGVDISRIEKALRLDYPDIIDQELSLEKPVGFMDIPTVQRAFPRLDKSQLLAIFRRMQQEEFLDQISTSAMNKSTEPGEVNSSDSEEMIRYGLFVAAEAKRAPSEQWSKTVGADQEQLMNENFRLKVLIAELVLENQKLRESLAKKE